MRVERAETVPYALPFREPYVTARGTLERREIVLLRLRTDDGPEGLGEAVPLALRGDAPLAEVERAIADAATRLIGLDLDASGDDPRAFAIGTMLELTAPRRLQPAAAAALESALFDLVAKTEGEPMWRFLGMDGVAPVECNATLTAAAPAEVAAQAEQWAADGFETFKLKLGAGHDDAATVAAVRDVVGPDARIRVDVNEAWGTAEAVAALRELERFGLELAEQPVEGLRGLARLAPEVEVPLAADEAIATEADAHRAVQRRACAYATAKLSKVGGAGAARRIAAVLPTYLSSALDGPIGIAAAGHAAQLIRGDGNDPGIAHGLATQRLFAGTIATAECSLRGGALHLPDAPGLGVAIDEEALTRHRIEAG
jgi:L-alanine-DL-glutamate epimerase-like enolase superfamily enzyme